MPRLILESLNNNNKLLDESMKVVEVATAGYLAFENPLNIPLNKWIRSALFGLAFVQYDAWIKNKQKQKPQLNFNY